jgi:hypothetical protein
MKELYQDLRMKEGGAKRPPIINREVASYLATNFVYDLKLELARDNTNGDDFWCAWAVYEDKYEGRLEAHMRDMHFTPFFMAYWFNSE